MRTTVAVLLVLACGWLLYDGECYVHTLSDEAVAFNPFQQRLEFGFRSFAWGGRSDAMRTPYAEAWGTITPLAQSAGRAGTWLFASLGIAVLLLVLTFVPRLRRLRWIGFAAALLGVAVYAVWMHTADWSMFAMDMQIGGGHGLSIYAWVVVALAGLGLLVPVFGRLGGALRTTGQRTRTSLSARVAPALRWTGVLAFGALVWLFVSDGMWRFSVGDRHGPRGTDWGVITFGLRRATDVSGAVGFPTKSHDLAYADVKLDGAPPPVRDLFDAAQRAATIAFWAALAGGIAFVVSGFAPRVASRWRVRLQVGAGLVVVAALLFAMVTLDKQVRDQVARTPRLKRKPPAHGLTAAALTAAATAGVAAFAGVVAGRGRAEEAS